MSRPQDSRLPYLPGIDALRAIAVLAVFFYHAGVGWMPGGFLGVDVFFVISGYLITSLLLSEQRRTGRVRLGQFWLRRARRLLPAVGVLIAVTMIVAAILATRLRRRHVAAGAQAPRPRRARRRRGLAGADLDPLRPERCLARLLRHRHPCRRPPGRRRPGGRRGRRPRLPGAQLPPSARLRPGALPRRLPLDRTCKRSGDRRHRPPDRASGWTAGATATRLARPAQLQLLSLALARAGAGPARPRRLAAARRADPAAAARRARSRRPLLPLRRAAFPRQAQVAGDAGELATTGAPCPRLRGGGDRGAGRLGRHFLDRWQPSRARRGRRLNRRFAKVTVKPRPPRQTIADHSQRRANTTASHPESSPSATR